MLQLVFLKMLTIRHYLRILSPTIESDMSDLINVYIFIQGFQDYVNK